MRIKKLIDMINIIVVRYWLKNMLTVITGDTDLA